MKKKILAGILSVLMSVTMYSPVRAEEPINPAGDEPEITEIQETEEPAETVEETGDPEEYGEAEETPEATPIVTEAPGTEEEDPAPVETPAVEEDPADPEETPAVIEDPAETEEPAEETPAAEEDPAETEEPAEEEAVIVRQSGEFGGVTVDVMYMSDTFEKEVTLVVSEAGEAETAALDAAFDGDYKAVDISFIDEDGNKCQPLEGKSVDVSLRAEDMITGNYQVMHVDGEGNISFVEDNLDISTGEISTAEIEVLVPEVIEVPVYEEVTQTVVIPAEMGTRTVDVTEEVTVPASTGTRIVEKTREVEVPAVIDYHYVIKTRTVNYGGNSVWGRLFSRLFKTYTKTETYYELEPYVVEEAYTKTETYTEEEEYEIPAHTETVVVGTREEEYVITPARTETQTTQIQVGTEWQETGEMVTVTRTVNVIDVEAAFSATEFSTYAVRTNTITSGEEYVIYRTWTTGGGWWPTVTHYSALQNDLTDTEEIGVSTEGSTTVITSGEDNIKWIFEHSGNRYIIYYLNDGVETYLQATRNGLTTTTNENNASTWSYNSSNGRLSATVGSSTRYLRYNNGWTTTGNNNNATTVYLAQHQSGPVPSAGIRVHYVNSDGEVIQYFGTNEYCDISETISTVNASSDHYATYAGGRIYDLVRVIDGYTYDSTYLSSYSSSTVHGDKINAEVLLDISDDWNYTYYGGTAGADNYTENTYDFGDITDVYVVYSKNTSDDGSGSGGGEEEELEEPSTGKTVIDNDDGTSTLSLSIAGSSKDVSKNQGANVIVIIDTSNSMTDERLAAAKEAARNTATELLGINGSNPGDDPLVEMFLIYFNTAAHPGDTWYSVAGANNTTNTTEGFNGAVNSIERHSGTNWERALQSALTAAQDHLAEEAQRSGRSDESSADYGRVDDTYVIFITDGQPSSKANDTNDYNDEAGAEEFYTQANYVQATDDARAIVEAGYDFYSIGIYGTIDVLHYLTNFAFTERSTYDTSKSSTANANNHFFTANNADTLSEVLSGIANTISGKLAVAGVSFSDGIATSVTSTNISASNASGFKYTVTNSAKQIIYEVSIANDGTATYTFGPASDYNGETFTVASNASGTAGTGSNGTSYTATCESKTTSFDYTTTTGETGTKTSTTTVYTVKIGDTEYKMSPASVDANGEVSWDLSGVGTIDSGYVWTVSFVVWPDQEAYDIVTDLNNGIETEYKWIDYDATMAADDPDSCAKAKYVNGTLQYYYDGVFTKDTSGNWVLSEYTHIVKYPNGTYAALTNTHQDVEYFIMNEDGTYVGPISKDITPPDPISLDAALLTVQKKWEVDLDKEQLIYALFDTWTGESNELSVTLHVFADGSTEEYTSTDLGWQDNGDGTGAYDWADETEDITLYGNTYTVGTLWEEDLAIAVGVMIAEEHAEEYGLTDYPYAMIDGVKYYVLEPGHDYELTETGFQNYRFDYIARKYHPMLVNGKMYNLENLRLSDELDAEGKQYYIFDDLEANMTALTAHNTLRGGINITKDVIDGDNNAYDTDALFTFNIKLENELGSLKDDSIPWYGIANGTTYTDGSLIYFYYHDADGNLYQASGVTTTTGGVSFTLYDEEGNSYAATSTEFAEAAGPAEITYTTDEGDVTIDLYGNVMTATSDGKQAEATASIPSSGNIRIANVPYKTTYTITEVEVTGFDLVEIEQTIQETDTSTDKTVTTLTEEDVTSTDPDAEAMKVRDETTSELIGIVDEIIPNNQNNMDFTNQTTADAFYVYHSSDNTVEKILFADTRVSNTYDDATDTIVYQFNLANETKAANLYGGYYKSYPGAAVTDDQITGDAAADNLVYTADTSDSGIATTYDGAHKGGLWSSDTDDAMKYDYAYIAGVRAGTTGYTDWGSDYYTGTGTKGTEMSPAVDTVYYLKEVPDHYDLPYTHYTYNKGDKLLRNMWYITAIDDLKYDDVGFIITTENEAGELATIVQTLTVTNATGGATVKLTPKSVFGGGTNSTTSLPNYVRDGYLGYWDASSLITANTTSVFTPYWKTMDGVTVRGLKTRTINFNSGKVGSGGMKIVTAATTAEKLLADIVLE